MRLSYYQAGVLTTVPHKGRDAAIEHHHKHAWALFTRNQPQTEYPIRPFLFRVDRTPGRDFFMLRSDRDFPGATAMSLNVDEGQTITLDLCLVPIRRKPDSKREYLEHPALWPRLFMQKMTLAGLTAVRDPETWRMDRRVSTRQRGANLSVVNARVTATIDDLEAFARAWIGGVGRRKAYGMGMLRIAPNSVIQAQAV